MTHVLLHGRSLLLLDFDGLICDTERAAYRSWELTYAEHGHTFSPRLWRQMAGLSTGEEVAAADLGRRLGRSLTQDDFLARRARKSALCDEEPLRPGVADLLIEARAMSLKVAVVSSSPRSWVHHHLVRLHVFDSFDLLMTGGNGIRPKPTPDLYLRALRVLDRTADDALAVEDSAVGVQAARAAGLDCVGVPNAVGARQSWGNPPWCWKRWSSCWTPLRAWADTLAPEPNWNMQPQP
ncbi:HAD family hydrolase [Streptomyces enissocaesilis]|uniref:HAD family hydrolase n=1 Tax=Streptomyces enissocaesilis TaxID=332589 RepID=A0ABP6K8P9_9ACTN